MRYFKYYNNAMTVPSMLGKGRMSMPSLFGFGQTDPILDAEPGADAGANQITEAAADTAVSEGTASNAAPVPVSRIEFYPDGTIVQRGVTGNALAVEWWKKLESALSLPPGAGADTVVAAADDLTKSRKTWKWATMIGVPVAALAAWFAAKRWGR
jgi:hypothetical protein